MDRDVLVRKLDRIVIIMGEDWKRLRIAITLEEKEALKERSIFEGKSKNMFVYALRAIPLQIESHPNDPLYTAEPLPDPSVGVIKYD